jgi:glutathione S-transferase
MKIHGDIISPFVRMCMVTAHEVGLRQKIALVPAAVKPGEVNAELVKLSPIGRIPVLETDHHHPIYDSRVIIEYLAHVAGNRSFIPDDGVKRFRVLTLLALAQGVAEAGVALRYEQAQRPEHAQWPAYADRLQARIVSGLDDMEQQWHDVLHGINAGSVAAACALGYLDYRHQALSWRTARPKLTAFSDTFNARDSMKAFPVG